MKSTFRTALVAGLALVVLAAGTALAAKYGDISEFRMIRFTATRSGVDYAASADLLKSELYAKQVFLVSTLAGAVDLDFGNDAAFSPEDIGAEWKFIVTAGGTNALTVTAGASGITTLTVVDSDGTTCEDVGDVIRVIVRSNTAGTVVTQCAD